MNGVDDEMKITKIWPLERSHSRLGLVVTMVDHGIWVQQVLPFEVCLLEGQNG
jgi:hypothetical protein